MGRQRKSERITSWPPIAAFQGESRIGDEAWHAIQMRLLAGNDEACLQVDYLDELEFQIGLLVKRLSMPTIEKALCALNRAKDFGDLEGPHARYVEHLWERARRYLQRRQQRADFPDVVEQAKNMLIERNPTNGSGAPPAEWADSYIYTAAKVLASSGLPPMAYRSRGNINGNLARFLSLLFDLVPSLRGKHLLRDRLSQEETEAIRTHFKDAHDKVLARANTLYEAAKAENDKLTAAERTGLRQLKLAGPKEVVNDAVARSLIQKGIAERKLGGLALTPVGELATGLLPV